MTDSEKLGKQPLINLLRKDPQIREVSIPGHSVGFLFYDKPRKKASNEVYEKSNKPSIQLEEFCFILNKLVDWDGRELATKADTQALTYIICKYILKDERKTTKNRVHNYAVYMKRLKGWVILA